MEKKTARKIIYNSFDDDFAGTDISTAKIGGDFRYLNGNPVWKAGSFLLYYGIAFPLVLVIGKVAFGVRVKNRRAVRKLGQGFFLYGNHTHWLDAFMPAIVSIPRRAYIVTSADAVSVKGLKNIVLMLGSIPVPSTYRAMKGFNEAVGKRSLGGSCVAVYPEAHIWPYYNRIRPFPSTSFTYPVKYGLPVIAMVTTFRKRIVFGNRRRPARTVYLSDPFYPDATLSPEEAREKLHDEVYAFMCEKAAVSGNREYIEYEYAGNGKESN